MNIFKVEQIYTDEDDRYIIRFEVDTKADRTNIYYYTECDNKDFLYCFAYNRLDGNILEPSEYNYYGLFIDEFYKEIKEGKYAEYVNYKYDPEWMNGDELKNIVPEWLIV